jgi:hypothetical protein
VSETSMFKSRIFGCSTCMRQKASNWRVSEAARSAVFSICWVRPRSLGDVPTICSLAKL